MLPFPPTAPLHRRPTTRCHRSSPGEKLQQDV
jgi:hypothetical protein